MVYRSGPGEDWQIVDSFQIIPGFNANDKRGSIEVFGLQKGEYAMAIYDAGRTIVNNPVFSGTCDTLVSAVQELLPGTALPFQVYPNPTRDSFTVSFKKKIDGVVKSVSVTDMNGKIIERKTVRKGTISLVFSTDSWSPGSYVVKVRTGTDQSFERIILIQ